MCSIGGFVSTDPLDRSTARMLATALLWYGAERGDQSSGIYINGKTVKRAIAPDLFIESPEFHNAFEAKTSDVCLTHTRMPTCGDLGDEQAQPFQINDTVSVHNGMYFDPGTLKARWHIKKPSGVDSELVARFIEAYGIKRLPDFIDEAGGVSAIAALWQGNVYAMRYGNPLSYTTLELTAGRILVFASTRDILVKALSHVWLLPPYQKIRDLGEGCLFEMRPGGPKQLGRSLGKHWKRYATDKSFYMGGKAYGDNDVDWTTNSLAEKWIEGEKRQG